MSVLGLLGQCGKSVYQDERRRGDCQPIARGWRRVIGSSLLSGGCFLSCRGCGGRVCPCGRRVWAGGRGFRRGGRSFTNGEGLRNRRAIRATYTTKGGRCGRCRWGGHNDGRGIRADGVGECLIVQVQCVRDGLERDRIIRRRLDLIGQPLNEEDGRLFQLGGCGYLVLECFQLCGHASFELYQVMECWWQTMEPEPLPAGC